MSIMNSGIGRTITWITALFAVVLPLSACGGAAGGADGGGEVTTIRYQSYAGAVDPLQLADALGYLEGLELEKVGDTTGGPMSLQALASRQTDIGASAFFGAITQLVATGVPIKAVVPMYGSLNGLDQKLVVPADSPITSARDLIGKKIAVNTLGANSEAVLDTWFEQEGLTQEEQDQVTLVVLPPLNTPQALEEGQVDAAVLAFLGYQQAAKSMELRTVVTDVDVVGPYSGGGMSMRTDFMEQNPETTKTLVEGIARAVNFVETHDKQEVFDVLFPYLEEHGYGDYVEPVEANFPGTLGVPAEPVIEDKDIELWLDWLESRGDVDTGAIDASDVYTNEYNPYAE
ncbi:ABC transporter substrate-binding protein [Nocardioides sp.]|uniref:ABC transporter substrate-binding protein n=1 Tax=Nocardioides sp. TaxID=35761 RepID=UPI001A19033C|nr:ABC transporter substrate-binding protein [Nocardioides sp.]MBJ7357056.1 ABC transporter substrate-binding protein [Nocardioides sp.]